MHTFIYAINFVTPCNMYYKIRDFEDYKIKCEHFIAFDLI